MSFALSSVVDLTGQMSGFGSKSVRNNTYHGFSKVCIGETHTDRLVNEENASVRVPGVRVEFCLVPGDKIAGP